MKINFLNIYKGFFLCYSQHHGLVLSLALFCSEYGVWILVPGAFLCSSKLFGMYVLWFYFSFMLVQILNLSLLALSIFFLTLKHIYILFAMPLLFDQMFHFKTNSQFSLLQ